MLRVSRHGRAIARVGWPCALALIVHAAGCAAPGSSTERKAQPVLGPEAFVGNQGGAWEVVFAPRPGHRSDGPEAARRDASLNIRTPETVIEAGMWPEPSLPRLERSRRLFLPHRAGEVLYLRGGPGHHTYGSWWVWR